MQIKKRKKDELILVRESSISIDEILSIFSNNSRSVIYTESEEGVLQGLITYENCRSYIDGTGELVDHTFFSVDEKELDIIEDIFNDQKNILYIPVLDERGRILYEYTRVEFLGNEFQHNRKQELKFCKLLHSCGIAHIVFVEAASDDKKFEKATELLQNGIDIAFVDTYDGIVPENSLVVDKGNPLRIRYRKMQGYKVVSSDNFWKLAQGFLGTRSNKTWNGRSLKNIPVFADMLNKTYNKIAVYDTNSITAEIIVELEKINKQIIVLDREVVYNLKKNVYEIPSKYVDIDVVVTADFDLMQYRILCNEKDIFNLNYILVGFAMTDYTEAYDIDIVNNVLPILEECKCKTIIFGTERVFETDRIDLVNTFENTNFKRFRNIFGVDDCYLKLPYGFDKGYLDFADYQSGNYNISMDKRKVIGAKEDAKRTIYMFGYCDFFGMFVKDSETSASFLQAMLPADYRVYNYASLNMVMQWKLRIPKFTEGDIVIIETLNPRIYQNAGYLVHKLYKDFIIEEFKKSAREVSWDMLNHGNASVMKSIAESVYMDLNEYLNCV